MIRLEARLASIGSGERHDSSSDSVGGGNGVQTQDKSTTSLYIRRNYSLYQQLTNNDLRVLELPTSPVEKKTIQDRWTALPSPLPHPPPYINKSAEPQHMPLRMKSLPSFGFSLKKSHTSKNGKVQNKNKKQKQCDDNVEAINANNAAATAMLPSTNRGRKRKDTVVVTPMKSNSDQTSITRWVVGEDHQEKKTKNDNEEDIVKIVGQSVQVSNHNNDEATIEDQQSSIMDKSYSAMEEKNNQTRKALHEIVNVLNRELINKNEHYKMLLEMQAPPENTSEILQLLGYCIGKTSRDRVKKLESPTIKLDNTAAEEHHNPITELPFHDEPNLQFSQNTFNHRSNDTLHFDVLDSEQLSLVNSNDDLTMLEILRCLDTPF
ncbi:uncharacterized protein LOC118434760 isoform X2 [Folsomia candida]|uniref:uncharacterized protein LOC118434760 isoform X2 n=1 Tax=Folsomia candida TaxID=158441 RepID=UPI001604C967|nr:uncharacterized protein LOC118434760 isoform X2 [Folsomia candida]